MVTKFFNVDTDNTLSSNSNERVSSQKAVKTYTDNLTNPKQNKVLDTPITVESTQETTVEGALNSINTSLSNKQNQSLSSSIVVSGTSQTTVEGTLNALNIYANSKQDTLVSGTNIKTVNGNSLLGSGNIDANGLPDQTGQSGKYLTTDGTTANWTTAIGANTDLSNLSAAGENHFVQLQIGISQADVDYVVESYVNGASWYRVYKSGWCEQGGTATVQTNTEPAASNTITLLKPYLDTNYTVIIGGRYARYTTTAEPGARPVDGSSFAILTGGDATDFYWSACGYIS